MKKVLIIAYHFPPSNAIGAQRPFKLAKFSPDNGWIPIVLTPYISGKRPDGIKLVETDYIDIAKKLKAKIGLDSEQGLQEQMGVKVSKQFDYPTFKSKFLKFVKELISYPDPKKGWFKPAIKAASQLIAEDKIDAIISTSGPVICHLIASKLKRRFAIPWIADYRDLWSYNPYSSKFAIMKYFEKRLEIKTLSNADALVTVTTPWIETLKTLHNNKAVSCITNGYDTEDFPQHQTSLTSKFTMTYTGQLYNGKRDPSLLFKAVADLIKENIVDSNLIEIRFYGPKENWLITERNKYGLDGIVHFHGSIPREEVLKKQLESQILLLLMWNNKNEEGFCPGKVYEYFGANRPIIAYGWHGSFVKDLLKKTNTGAFSSNYEELKKSILNYYDEFIKSGRIEFRSNNYISNYSYELIAKKYASLLTNTISSVRT